MYQLRPTKVYALESALEDSRSRARLERILGAIEFDPGEVVTFTEEDVPEVVAQLDELSPPGATAPGGKPTWPDRVLQSPGGRSPGRNGTEPRSASP